MGLLPCILGNAWGRSDRCACAICALPASAPDTGAVATPRPLVLATGAETSRVLATFATLGLAADALPFDESMLRCLSRPAPGRHLTVVLATGLGALQAARRATLAARQSGDLVLFGFAPVGDDRIPDQHAFRAALALELGCAVIEPVLNQGWRGLAALAAAPIGSLVSHPQLGADIADLRAICGGASPGAFLTATGGADSVPCGMILSDWDDIRDMRFTRARLEEIHAEVRRELELQGHVWQEHVRRDEMPGIGRAIGAIDRRWTRIWLHVRGGNSLQVTEVSRLARLVEAHAHPDANFVFTSTVEARLAGIEIGLIGLRD